MSLHINRFLDRLKAADLRQQREFCMSLQEARDLHADITKMLLVLTELQEAAVSNNQITTVEIRGSDF
jgi:hypothetical protein